MHTSIAPSPVLPSVPSFAHFSLLEPLQKALASEGYQTPTPIQAQAIPHLLQGRDLLGCAQTGTGKTAAFALPVLDRLARLPRTAGARGPRALVLAPTRELALQVAESFRTYGRHVRVTCATVFGGVGQQPQVDAIRRGADVVVATPGRLLDLMEQGHIRFEALSVLVLDEADRMLDMGFIRDIRKILAVLPPRRQNMLFSATMPPDIAELAASLLNNPLKVAVAPMLDPGRADRSVGPVRRRGQQALAADRGLAQPRPQQGAGLHPHQTRGQPGRRSPDQGRPHGGGHSRQQVARVPASGPCTASSRGRVRVLVATDIAARGIDVDGITHVINFELPNEPESYVHRIGRTARAGATGIALSFCDDEERANLRSIERLTRSPVRVVSDHPFASASSGREDRTSPTGAPEGQGQRPRGGRTYYSSRSGPARRHRRS